MKKLQQTLWVNANQHQTLYFTFKTHLNIAGILSSPSQMYCVLLHNGLYCLCSPPAGWIQAGCSGLGAGAEQPLVLRHHPASEEGDGHLLALVTCTTRAGMQNSLGLLQPRPSDLEIHSLCNTASTQSLFITTLIWIHNLLLVLVQRQFLSLAMNAFISSKSRAGPGHPANVEHLEAGGADSHHPLPGPHKITVTFTGHVAHSTPSYHLDTRGTWVSPGAVSAMNEWVIKMIIVVLNNMVSWKIHVTTPENHFLT